MQISFIILFSVLTISVKSNACHFSFFIIYQPKYVKNEKIQSGLKLWEKKSKDLNIVKGRISLISDTDSTLTLRFVFSGGKQCSYNNQVQYMKEFYKYITTEIDTGIKSRLRIEANKIEKKVIKIAITKNEFIKLVKEKRVAEDLDESLGSCRRIDPLNFNKELILKSHDDQWLNANLRIKNGNLFESLIEFWLFPPKWDGWLNNDNERIVKPEYLGTTSDGWYIFMRIFHPENDIYKFTKDSITKNLRGDTKIWKN